MDFGSKNPLADGESNFEETQGMADQAEGSSATGGSRRILRPGADNVVVLPAGASLDDIEVDGNDLVIELADGTVVVVPDGAIIVPQLVVEGVAVPPATIAALLVGNEPEPAAGPPQSSGGDFATDPGAIQAAYGLGDLLPYTELQFEPRPEEEIIPGLADQDPDIVIETPDNPAGAIEAIASVDEAGLPGRTVDGVDENPGTASETDAETTTGTIVFAAPDGVQAVLINGVAITSVGQTFTSPDGTLTITSIDLANGEIGFRYTLADNLVGSTEDGFFEMTVVDVDGDSSTATLRITVVDDEPIARADIASIDGGTYGPVGGNVVTSNDESGADGYGLDGAVTGFATSGGTAGVLGGAPLVGTYGTLTMDADGNFEYTRFFNTPGGVSEQFTYSIVDGDGSPASATLTINIGDAENEITFVPDTEESTVVNENQLPPSTDTRTDESAGSAFDGDSESTTGTITFTSPDGVQSVTVAGTAINPDAPFPQTVFSDETGTLVVNGYTYDPETGQGSITYTYTLNDNTGNPDGTVVTFPIVVTDLDGDTAGADLDITILDDEPVVNPDTDVVFEDGPLAAIGNVITDAEANGDGGADTKGADGASVTAIFFGATEGTVGGDPLPGLYGSLTIDADGNYTYALDNDNAWVQGLDSTESLTEVFTYTLTDGDGDARQTTLTITINGADDGVTIEGLGVAGGELTVDEDDLADGSSPDTAALVQSSSFKVDSPDGLATLTVGGTAVWGEGVTYPVAVAGSYGEIRITGVTVTTDASGDVVTAEVFYEYELSDNTTDHAGSGQDSLVDSFEVVATDTDGSPDTASLDVKVVDDVATARPDADSVTEDGPLTAVGNVVTDAEGNGGADTEGADGASVTGISFGATAGIVGGAPLPGLYGSLTIDAQGNYTYTLDNDNPSVQGLDSTESLTEVFTYRLTDGDGDARQTTLTITINGADDGVTIDGLATPGGEVTLDEDDLAKGSDTTPEPLTQSGEFTVDSPDGLAKLTVGGVTVFDAGAATTYPVTIADPVYGRLQITAVTTTTDADGDVVSAKVTYSYVLQNNSLLHTGGNDGSFTDSFEVIATDSDGSKDSDFLDVTVVDDVPTANDDPDAQQANENEAFTIDALDNDVFGADGVAVGNATKVFVSAQANQGTVTYDPVSHLFTYKPAPGAGSGGNTTDSFEYTIVDRDGDVSTATVTVELQPDSEPRGSQRVATVDDDGIAGGNPNSTAGDLDANIGDADASSEAIFVGTLGFDVGLDTPAEISFASSLNGATAQVGLETVTYSVSGTTLTATGPRGTLFTVEITDTETGEYRVTLVDNVLHEGGPNAEGFDASVDLEFVVTDADDDTASTYLSIVFDDDAPTAYDNTAGVTEGGQVGGNLLADGIDDLAGADGFAPSGAIQSVSSNNVPANTATTDLNGNLVIVGQYGTLTVDPQTGTYNYKSTANATNADVDDIFSYTIVDADGDTATATLTIGIDDVAGNVFDDDVLVDEAGLADGSSALDGSQIDADGKITVDGASGPFVYSLDGGTFSNNGTPLDPSDDTYTLDGSYGTIVLNAATGTYTYVLDTAYTDSDLGENTTNTINGAESFHFQVRDASNNLIGEGDIGVNIVDDVPTAENEALLSIAEDAVGALSGNVMANDTEGADGATVTSFTVGGVVTAVPQNGSDAVFENANGIYKMDMDGNWSFDPKPGLDQSAGAIVADFSYTLTDGDDDFDTATQPIRITDGQGPADPAGISLSVDDQNLADGSTPANPQPEEDSATISFVPGSDPFDTILFSTDLGDLDGGLTWVRDSGTQISGYDGARLVVTLTLEVSGNDATVKATLADNYLGHSSQGDEFDDLGFVEVLATDLDGDVATGRVDVGVSDDTPTLSAGAPTGDVLSVDETDLATDATADFSGLFTPDYNADGAGGVSGYTLGFTDTATGLVDTATGEAVILVMNGTAIEGRTETTDELVFTIGVDTAGTVTFDQERAVKHGDDTDPDDAEPVPAWDADLITLTATVTDGDGDTSPATANIGGAFEIRDDGPSIMAAVSDDDSVMLVTQDADTEGNAFDTASSTTDFSGAFTVDSSDGGADGTASIDWSYSLEIESGSSGLASGGDPINLFLVDGVVVGSTAGAPPADLLGLATNPDVVFTIAVAPDTGVVTVNQYQQVDHDLPGATADYDLQSEPLPTDKINLVGKATITDRDGDTADSTVSLDLGDNIKFADDGPEVASITAGSSVDVDETDAGNLSGYPISDTSGAPIITYTGNFGADGAASSNSIVYSLSIVGGGATGLQTAQGGFAISLVPGATADVVLGVYDNGVDAGDQIAFSVTINDDGTLTLEQNVPLEHETAGDDSGGEHNDTLSLSGLIEAQVTLTDFDGDSDSAKVGIGDRITFYDDGPSVSNNATVQLDDDALGGNAGGTGDDADSVATTGTLGFDFGGDGAGSIAFSTAGAPSGFTYVANGTGILVVQDQNGSDVTVLTITLDPQTGAYTVTQNNPILHADGSAENNQQFTLGYTVTDADDDTAEGMLTIDVDDDTPIAVAGTTSGTVDEEGLAGGIADGPGDVPGTSDTATGSVTGLFSAGADTPLTYGFTGDVSGVTLLDGSGDPVTSGGVGVTYSISGNTLTASAGATTVFTLTINPTTGSWTFDLDAVLDHPSNNSEDDIVLQFGGLVQATDADGDDVTATGALTVTVDDDSPVAATADAASVTNSAGSMQSAYLDSDDDIDNNFGADGGAAIFTDATITSLLSQDLTSGLSDLYYEITGNGSVLTAYRESDDHEVFEIVMEPSGFEDRYQITMSESLDAVQDIDFNGDGYDFVGGNGSWAGFNVPLSAGSQDLLLTPIENGSNAGSVNTNANEGGVSDGNSVKIGEALRADFVIDLTNSPPSNLNYQQSGGANHDFSGHYLVNGASALFTAITGGANPASTVQLTAFDDFDGDDVVGDGTPDDITQIVIEYNNVRTIITQDGPVNVGGHAFDVTFEGDGTVVVTGVVSNTRIAGFTDDGYSSIEFANIDYNGVTSRPFKIGDFGAFSLVDDPVPFTVPFSIEDGDGDRVDSGTIDITATPSGMSGSSSSTAMALFSTTAELVEPVNDNGGVHSSQSGFGQSGDLLVSGTSYQSHFGARTMQMTTLAAIAGGIFLPQFHEVSDLSLLHGTTALGPVTQIDVARITAFEHGGSMARSFEFGEVFDHTVAAQPTAEISGTRDYHFDLSDLPLISFAGEFEAGPAPVMFDAPGFELPEPSAMGFAEGSMGGDAMAMEALLLLEAPSAQGSMPIADAKVALEGAVADLAAEVGIEALVSHFAPVGDPGFDAVGIHHFSMAEGLLDTMVQQGMAPGAMAGMTPVDDLEQAASLAAATA